MPFSRALVSLFVLAVGLAGCAPAGGPAVVQAAPGAQTTPGCPVTQPQTPAFRPPAPWPATLPYDGQFWYGSDSLWTDLNTSGVWSELPYDEASGYGQKIAWWRAGYDDQTEEQPALFVTGWRLDGDPNVPAQTATASPATNGFHEDLQSFMLVGMDFPSAGCWEITGEYHGERLSFVVLIEP
jgi:hypothetical protein